jgi:hypothetical protein
VIVVIPSNRSISLEYLQPLIECGARFIVVDDSEGSIRIDHPQFEVYNWADRRKMLGSLEIAIPKGNGACRDLGFLIAWREGDAGEAIVALDDDCVVQSRDFVRQVEAQLSHGTWTTMRGDGHQYNIFDQFGDLDTTRYFPRGFPFSSRVGYRPWAPGDSRTGTVSFNLGLWHGVLDINALDAVFLGRPDRGEAGLRWENVVLPTGALTSVCSGNMHFRRELIPACYQLPMNVEILPRWTIDRYGDIWGGYILKSLMDIRGDLMAVGGPLVHHLREGDATRNIAREHLAHLVSEEFIECLSVCCGAIEPAPYPDMMAHLREEMMRFAERASPILAPYLKHVSLCLGAWLPALTP